VRGFTDRYRFTAYAGEIPAGHGPTPKKACDHAQARGMNPTAVVLRLRDYPYTKLRRYWT
jgi:hypothetical protein